MAFQVVPDVASFRLEYVGGALQEFVNTIYVRNTIAGWDSSHLAATSDDIADAWIANMCPLIDDAIIFKQIVYRDEGAEFGDFGVDVRTAACGLAGDPVSSALATLVTLNGDGGSAPRQGHLFIPGLTETVISGDIVSNAHVDDIETAIAAVNAALVIAGDAWVIVSRYSKTEVPLSPHKRPEGVSNTISSFVGRSLVATQRDRRTGIGS